MVGCWRVTLQLTLSQIWFPVGYKPCRNTFAMLVVPRHIFYGFNDIYYLVALQCQQLSIDGFWSHWLLKGISHRHSADTACYLITWWVVVYCLMSALKWDVNDEIGAILSICLSSASCEARNAPESGMYCSLYQRRKISESLKKGLEVLGLIYMYNIQICRGISERRVDASLARRCRQLWHITWLHLFRDLWAYRSSTLNLQCYVLI